MENATGAGASLAPKLATLAASALLVQSFMQMRHRRRGASVTRMFVSTWTHKTIQILALALGAKCPTTIVDVLNVGEEVGS